MAFLSHSERLTPAFSAAEHSPGARMGYQLGRSHQSLSPVLATHPDTCNSPKPFQGALTKCRCWQIGAGNSALRFRRDEEAAAAEVGLACVGKHPELCSAHKLSGRPKLKAADPARSAPGITRSSC